MKLFTPREVHMAETVLELFIVKGVFAAALFGTDLYLNEAHAYDADNVTKDILGGYMLAPVVLFLYYHGRDFFRSPATAR